MPPKEEPLPTTYDEGEPRALYAAVGFTFGMGVLHAAVAAAEECLRKFNILMALLNILFAGWLFGWLRCRDEERHAALTRELDASRREADELRARTGAPGGTS